MLVNMTCDTSLCDDLKNDCFSVVDENPLALVLNPFKFWIVGIVGFRAQPSHLPAMLHPPGHEF